MHITEKTEFGTNGVSPKVVINEFLGRIVGTPGSCIAYNAKTGETYDDISLYQQIYDRNGDLLKSPVIGDNEDYYFGSPDDGNKIKLIDYFLQLKEQEREQEEKVYPDKKDE